MDLKKFGGKINFENMVIGLALIIIGILFLIFPENSMRIVCFVSGAVLIAVGIVRFILFFARGMKDAGALPLSAILFCFGILLIVRQGLLQEFITLAFGIVLVADGFSKLQEMIRLVRAKRGIWFLFFLETVLFVGLGVVVLIQPFGAAKTLGYFLGGSLIAEGVIDVITALLLGKSASPRPAESAE